MKHKYIFAFLFVFPFFFSSCFGVHTEIALNQNGSGTVTLEYQISKLLDSLGKLDGNERWSTIPVGKADFERTVDRLQDLKMLSFSSKENEKNVIISAKLEFSSIKGLLGFLDASGLHSSFSGDSGSGNLIFTLAEGSAAEKSGMNQLILSLSQGYSVKMSFTFPSEGKLNISDNNGKTLAGIPGSEINSVGKKVSFSFPLSEVLSSKDGIKAEFIW